VRRRSLSSRKKPSDARSPYLLISAFSWLLQGVVGGVYLCKVHPRFEQLVCCQAWQEGSGGAPFEI
jgi:hypothetical protein